MNAVAGETKQQQDNAGAMLQAVKDRDYWVKVINDVNSRLPKEYVWITSFEPQIVGGETTPAATTGGRAPTPGKKGAGPTPVVLIKGLYLWNDRQTTVVDEFMKKLAESDLYSIGTNPKTIINVPNEGEWAYEYSFPLVLKDPIAFTPPPSEKRNK